MYNRSAITLGLTILAATATSVSAAGISAISLKPVATHSSFETGSITHKVAKRKKILKRVIVRRPTQLRRVLAARGKDHQAVEISCKPATSTWCSTDFADACGNQGGIGSTQPDGSAVCSFPDVD